MLSVHKDFSLWWRKRHTNESLWHNVVNAVIEGCQGQASSMWAAVAKFKHPGTLSPCGQYEDEHH